MTVILLGIVSFVLGVYIVSRLVTGIVSAKRSSEFFMMLNGTPLTPTHHSEIMQMSQTLGTEQDTRREGAKGTESMAREQMAHGLHFKPPVEPLLLLLQAMQLNGKALPEDSFIAMTVGAQVREI